MEIHTFTFGDLETNCYVVCNDTACFIIDPVSDKKQDIDLIHEAIGGRKLKYILYTHNHFDHIGGGHKFDVPGYMHKKDRATLYLQKPASWLYMRRNINLPKTQDLGNEVKFGNVTLKVLHTPGHTSGSVSFFMEVGNEKYLFSGDTLFQGTYGRTDLPTGNMSQMSASLHELAKLPGHTIVLPGHGLHTTIEKEKGWISRLAA